MVANIIPFYLSFNKLYLFDDLIDHSYDLEINSKKRMMLVFKEIKRLNNINPVNSDNSIVGYVNAHTWTKLVKL